jgi:hypothetical protein
MYMEKIKQLYQFLKEYNQIKNPSILTIDKNEDFISISDLPKSKFIKYVHSEDPDKNIILYLSRPVIEDFPQLPKRLDGWICDLDNDTKPEKIKITESIKVNIDGQTKLTFLKMINIVLKRINNGFNHLNNGMNELSQIEKQNKYSVKYISFLNLLENQSENFELVVCKCQSLLKRASI